MIAGRIERTGLLAGLLFVSIALLLLFVLIPYGVDAPRKVKFAALHPAYYPRLVAYVLLLLGAATVLSSFKTRANDPAKANTPDNTAHRGLALLSLAALAVIVFFMLPLLGFPLATCFALLVALPLAGERRWWLTALVSVVLPLLLYLFFTKVANIPIPGGVLEPWLLKL